MPNTMKTRTIECMRPLAGLDAARRDALDLFVVHCIDHQHSATITTPAASAIRPIRAAYCMAGRGNRQRVNCRRAGDPVEQCPKLRLNRHACYSTIIVVMGKCVTGPVNAGNRAKAARIS